ncbi:MAG: glycine cleavage system aminomethyltransferase GcvT [Sulfolobales archaeon]|nr:glycine cleavage system aminomethyltransferase GcvT [Sulfolobales archaeon]MDW8082977.1 glycine cleavage system aminomethyltransferase GcvT [Sulfolobales archaeon]
MRSVPLLDLHRSTGGNLGEFGGWLTSLDFGDPASEHISVRTSVAFFDVSHMGRLILRGKRVLDFLQRVVGKDLSKVRESFMSGPALLLNERGGMIDDIMLYYVREDTWFAVVNAVNIEKDYQWLNMWKNKLGYSDIEIEDVTQKSVLIAIQGPKSLEVLESLGVRDAGKLKILEFRLDVELEGGRATLLSRSGWTGEEVRSHGFEVWCSVDVGARLFNRLASLGVRAAGLIARDTLRLEAGYLLSTVDFDESITPPEARYWMAWDLEKEGYIGAEAVKKKYIDGVDKVRVGLRFKKGERFIPRHGDPVVIGEKEVGYVTSGTYSTYLNRAIAVAYVSTRYVYVGGTVFSRSRGRLFEAKIVEPPFI